VNVSLLLQSLAGGALLGTATAILLASEGRSEGVSGMASRILVGSPDERAGRIAFLVGLASTGLAASVVAPGAFAQSNPRSLLTVALAGVLIGLGARIANGCTSGHGILGVSRLSRRGLAAVSIFCATAALTVFALPLAGRP
jgi:uncharacterized protein